MTLTYPLVGNYGVPPFTRGADGIPDYMEGDHIYAEAIIVSDYSENYSHWNAAESLGDWLKREQIPGITGIDTRALTKALREHGVMMGRIVFDDDAIDNGQLTIDNYGDINYVDRVSCKEIIVYNGNESRKFSIDTPKEELNCQLSIVNCQLKKVVLVDCGVKANILRCLIRRGVEVIRVPWDYDFNGLDFDGLSTAWTSTACSSPTAPVIRTRAMRRCRTSARQWPMRSSPSSASAWATSSSPRPGARRYTS